jgi:hypothetical protein
MAQRSRSIRNHAMATAFLLAAASAGQAGAESVQIAPAKDNTLYADGTGGISNGAGEYFFVGQAGSVRRGLLAFDVAGSIPPGATITSVQLALHCSRLPYFAPPPVTVTLQRLTADWGEGTSDAGEPGGTGTSATPGDATWIHRAYPGSPWTNPGGDFAPAASASFPCGGVGTYTVGSTAGLVADVQAWLDGPSSNFGWILRGEEGAGQNARRFDSREHASPGFRPVLTIEYTPAVVGVAPSTWSTVKGLYHE